MKTFNENAFNQSFYRKIADFPRADPKKSITGAAQIILCGIAREQFTEDEISLAYSLHDLAWDRAHQEPTSPDDALKAMTDLLSLADKNGV